MLVIITLTTQFRVSACEYVSTEIKIEQFQPKVAWQWLFFIVIVLKNSTFDHSTKIANLLYN